MTPLMKAAAEGDLAGVVYELSVIEVRGGCVPW